MPACTANTLRGLLAVLLLAASAQAQIVMPRASQSCLRKHNVLTGECDRSRIDYDDCNCIVQQLKCYSPADCNYVRFSSSADLQCDMGIDRVMFTQACGAFRKTETAGMSSVASTTMLVMLALILVALMVWLGLCCLPGVVPNLVYVIAAVAGIIAFDILCVVFAIEVIRRIEAMWFAVFVGFASVLLQCTICYIVVPMLDALNDCVQANNRNNTHRNASHRSEYLPCGIPLNPAQDYAASAPPQTASIVSNTPIIYPNDLIFPRPVTMPAGY